MGEPSTDVRRNADESTLPTDEDGFDVVEYLKPKDECEVLLENWKQLCKSRSRIDNLKVGPWFKEQFSEWAKTKKEAKFEKKSYPDFSTEDWMLTDLRAEIHYVLHAFQVDVKDETIPGFIPSNFSFYYKLYTGKPFLPTSFGYDSVEELLQDLVSDVCKIEDHLVVANLAKDADPITFCELAQAAKEDRQDRLDAGDEMAALRFSSKHAAKAQLIPKSHTPTGPKSAAQPNSKEADRSKGLKKTHDNRSKVKLFPRPTPNQQQQQQRNMVLKPIAFHQQHQTGRAEETSRNRKRPRGGKNWGYPQHHSKRPRGGV